MISVFLADDHVVLREGLRLVIEHGGAMSVVGEAADGRAALASIAALRPDVAVLDISMPELNGLELARKLIERQPQTRVVMLSMHSDAEHVAQALRAGALGYVLKESAGREVVQAIRSAHSGRRYLSRRLDQPGFLAAIESSSGASPVESLSRREREVLQLVTEGRTSAEIAAMLHLSPKTVDTYRSRLMQKLGVSDLAELVKFAVRLGITPLR